VIPITRRLGKTVRSVFRAALGLSARANGPPLHVQCGGDGLTVSAATREVGIRYQLAGSFSDCDFWLPFEFLAATEGTRNDVVLIEPAADEVQVQWTVDNVPQTRTFPLEQPPEHLELPEIPFTDNPAQLLVALAEATYRSSTEERTDQRWRPRQRPGPLSLQRQWQRIPFRLQRRRPAAGDHLASEGDPRHCRSQPYRRHASRPRPLQRPASR